MKEPRIAELEQRVENLQFAIQELTVLKDLAIAAGQTSDVDQMLDTIVEKSIRAVRAEQGSILLVTEEKDAPLKTLIRHEDNKSRLMTYKVSISITGWVLKHLKPLKVDDLANDPRFNVSEQESREIRSLLCIPILSGARLLGVLMVTNKNGHEPFSDSDLRLLTIIASQSGQLIRNSQLQQEAFAKKEQELAQQRLIARRLQELDKLKDELLAAYDRFVPHEFLRALGRETIVDVQLGDQVHGEMTVLFSDIRAYSTLAESMTPEENFNFLNAYFRRVGPVISEHNGFVNQFYGDGIMALYLGKPADAIAAAIEMHRRVESYNRERREKGRVSLNIGVGLHTGPLMLGIIGDENRLNAGVVSDTVNTASRMEGLTKFYGAPVVISENTLGRLDDPQLFPHRFLGKVRVKGKTKPLSVFEITNANSQDVYKLKQQSLNDFETGMKYFFDREFTNASVHFKKVLDVNPQDKTAQFYLERSARYMVQGVGDNWEGVETLDSK